MDISYLPCPNGLCSHGTFNVLDVLEHQTEMRKQFELHSINLIWEKSSKRSLKRTGDIWDMVTTDQSSYEISYTVCIMNE